MRGAWCLLGLEYLGRNSQRPCLPEASRVLEVALQACLWPDWLSGAPHNYSSSLLVSTQQHCGNDGKYLHTTPLMGCLDHLATGNVKYCQTHGPSKNTHCAGGRTIETEMAAHLSLFHREPKRPSPIYVSVAYAHRQPRSPVAWE